VVAQWLDHQTIDSRVRGSNQRLGLLAKPCNPATGGPEQGIVAEASLYNPDGTCGGDLTCFKLAVREESDSGASWDWSIAPPGYKVKQTRNLQRYIPVPMNTSTCNWWTAGSRLQCQCQRRCEKQTKTRPCSNHVYICTERPQEKAQK
jgi:hypothetical protein